MKQAMDMVAEFHAKHGAPVLDRVATPEEMAARRVLRMALIMEEASELELALGMDLEQTLRGEPPSPPDVTAVADALADLAYVTIGAALEWGIPLDRVFAEVHRSNMTKTVGPVRGDGKILKGEGYEPPRIGEVMAAPDETVTAEEWEGWDVREHGAYLSLGILSINIIRRIHHVDGGWRWTVAAPGVSLHSDVASTREIAMGDARAWAGTALARAQQRLHIAGNGGSNG